MTGGAWRAIEGKRKHYEFWDDEKEMIQSSHSSSSRPRGRTTSIAASSSGDPGFVKIVGSNVIPSFHEYDGNSMYRTISNISKNENVGLRCSNPLRRQSRRIRVNGRAAIFVTRHRSRPAFRREAGGARRMRNLSQLPALCARHARRQRRVQGIGEHPAAGPRHAAIARMEAPQLHSRRSAKERSASR